MGGARTSAGDPARTLELLWRQPTGSASGRGPRRRLSIDEIVEAATALADADGLDALTMRRVAQTLGAAPMTLYTYVPSKAELLDLMLDWIYGQMAHADRGDEWWRPRLEGIAHENRMLFKLHPWAATVSTVRPPPGPGLMAKYDRELRALDEIGLDDVEMDAVLTVLLGLVRTSALAEAEAQAATHESDMNDEQWWHANAPLLTRVMDETAYPTAARVGAATGSAHGTAYSPDHSYHFGLQRVLDGLGALIDRRST